MKGKLETKFSIISETDDDSSGCSKFSEKPSSSKLGSNKPVLPENKVR